MISYKEKYKFCKSNAHEQYRSADINLLTKYNPHHGLRFRSCTDSDILHKLLEYVSQDEILEHRAATLGYAEETTEAPAEEVEEKVVDEVAEKVTEEVTEETTEAPAEEVEEKVADEVAEKATQKAAEKTTEKKTQKKRRQSTKSTLK